MQTKGAQSIENFLKQVIQKAGHRTQGEQATISAQAIEKTDLSPELRKWLLEQFNEEEAVLALREMREKGGLELSQFLPELEQAVREGKQS